MRDPAKATMDRAANAPRDKASESDGAIERTTSEHGGPASLPRGSGEPDALHDPSVRGQEDDKDEQLTDALVSEWTKTRERSDRIRKNDALHAEGCRRKRWRAELRAKIVEKTEEKVAKLIDAEKPETVAAIIAAERAAEVADATAKVDAYVTCLDKSSFDWEKEKEYDEELHESMKVWAASSNRRMILKEMQDELKLEREPADKAPAPGGTPPSTA